MPCVGYYGLRSIPLVGGQSVVQATLKGLMLVRVCGDDRSHKVAAEMSWSERVAEAWQMHPERVAHCSDPPSDLERVGEVAGLSLLECLDSDLQRQTEREVRFAEEIAK